MGRGGRFGLSLTWPARRSDSFVKGLDCVSGVAYRDCALNRPKWGLERGYKASNAEIIRIFNMGRRTPSPPNHNGTEQTVRGLCSAAATAEAPLVGATP